MGWPQTFQIVSRRAVSLALGIVAALVVAPLSGWLTRGQRRP